MPLTSLVHAPFGKLRACQCFLPETFGYNPLLDVHHIKPSERPNTITLVERLSELD